MASKQLLCELALLLLLPYRLTNGVPYQNLSGRQLNGNGASVGSAGSADSFRDDGRVASDSSQRLAYLTKSLLSPPPPPPWELELAPDLVDLFPRRDLNTTLLRGPPRLTGVFKGSWLRTIYGKSLRPQDTLSSEHGVIVLRLPADSAPGDGQLAATSGATAGGSGQLPGGLQELQGELVIRDGDRVTDHDLRFRLRGVYVPAAGTVHAVLEPQLPLILKSEVNSSSVSSRGSNGDPQGRKEAARQQRNQQRQGQSFDASADGGGSRGAGGGGRVGHVESSGYREALRTAARSLVILGPAWYRTLVLASPPPPPSPGGWNGRWKHAGVNEDRQSSPPSPPPPPRSPLELALLQNCELRADFRVYYKGDPDAKSHAQFLRLSQLPSPPSPGPPGKASTWGARKRDVGGAAAPAGSEHVEGAAIRHSEVPGRPASAVAASAATVRQMRRLAADTEIYHNTQMQLHADTAVVTAAAGGTVAAAATPDAVYGIPAGMDPLDPDLELVGVVMSTNCEFAVHFNATSVHLERYYRQAVRYSVLVATVTIAQIVLSVSQSESASTPSAAARMSLYSVTVQAILDAYQCLLHLTGALVVDALFGAFASIAFLQFLLFAVFEMRQTLLVWRAQRTNGGGGGDFWTVRRDMSAVYFRFYGLLILGLLMMFECRSHLALLVLMLHSWWLPQIIHSAQSDTRPPLKAEYVWGMSGLRLLSPLYFYGCPSNLLRVEQHPGVCLALLVWVGLQAALITVQMRLGPRLFIPRAFVPRRYEYHRPATKREMGIEEHIASTAAAVGATSSSSTSASASGASIAAAAGPGWWRWSMSSGRPPLLRRLVSWLPSAIGWFRRPSTFSAGRSVAAAAATLVQRAAAAGGRHSGGGGGAGPDDGDVETGHGSKECVICMNPVPLLPLNARMLTPCGHFFHEPCLKRWMEVKMDCPTCRSPLPPA